MYVGVQRPEDIWCPAVTLHLISLRHSLSLNLELGWQSGSPSGSPVSALHSAGTTGVHATMWAFLRGFWDPNSVFALAQWVFLPTEPSLQMPKRSLREERCHPSWQGEQSWSIPGARKHPDDAYITGFSIFLLFFSSLGPQFVGWSHTDSQRVFSSCDFFFLEIPSQTHQGMHLLI